MTRWGMVIDLQKCIGCDGCMEVCKAVNRTLPDAFWRQVVPFQEGEGLSASGFNLPMNCMHCSEPPCLKVCPTTATYSRSDGIVDVHYDLCIGCGYCVVACPYFARFPAKRERSSDVLVEFGDQKTHEWAGVVTKCNFCLPRIEAGLEQGLEIGVAPEATPTCVVYCAGKALYFGDLHDPNSQVSRLIYENKTFQLQRDLKTEPAIFYLDGNFLQELSGNAESALVPSRKQDVWGWPAVINFVLGGMAAGLFLLSSMLNVLGEQSIGFTVLTFEAGRPFRSFNIFRHLRQSWMSREALAGVVFILLGLFDWLVPHPIFSAITAVAAAGFMIGQGFMVYRASAIAAWNVPLIPFLFVTSGLASGGSLALLLAGTPNENQVLGAATLVCLVSNLILWLLYLFLPGTESFKMPTRPLRRPASLFLVVGLGHLFPMLLLTWFLVGPNQTLAVLAGTAVLIGITAQKASLILKAGYLRSVRMNRT